MGISELKERLSALPAGIVRFGEPLSEHTTFRIGGPADVFVEADCLDTVVLSLSAARECGVAAHVLGCGSNLLVSDAGVRGLVVHFGAGFSGIEVAGDGLRAQAGATNEAAAAAACKAGLSGFEFASGIPGSVGGGAIMNAGAYDGQFADVVSSILCLAPSGQVVALPAEEAQWSYRGSKMASEGLVVLEVALRLVPARREDIQSRMDELARLRAEKQPLELPSAGSTFKRPEGHYAGALIDAAGMRGFAIGGAQVSVKHCGFVVNAGNASAADVRAVISAVQEAVLHRSGVALEPEVRFWE